MSHDTAPVPLSRRRRAATPPRRGPALPMPRVIAVVVVLFGALMLGAGTLRATVFAPSEVVTAAGTRPGQPVVSTAIGLLGLEGPRVRVDVKDSKGRPVFIGIGRAGDVDAYLAKVARSEVIGHDGAGSVRTRRLGLEPSLPDPASADVWLVSRRGTGSGSLTWPDTPGQWRLVVATDGTAAAPDRISFTWTGREVHTAAPALIAIGLVLLVGGAILLVMLASRSRLGGSR